MDGPGPGCSASLFPRLWLCVKRVPQILDRPLRHVSVRFTVLSADGPFVVAVAALVLLAFLRLLGRTLEVRGVAPLSMWQEYVCFLCPSRCLWGQRLETSYCMRVRRSALVRVEFPR